MRMQIMTATMGKEKGHDGNKELRHTGQTVSNNNTLLGGLLAGLGTLLLFRRKKNSSEK